MIACLPLFIPIASAEQIVLVDRGTGVAPIIVAEEASSEVQEAADDLAGFIEQISGARPAIKRGTPEPLPSRAIWVGYQPCLAELFPNVDFDFQHPEEILIAARDNHLVIAGRDRAIEGTPIESGTANGVYTFAQKYLDVRWLWPGELGLDIVEQKTIAFEPFEYRYRPPVLGRSDIFRLSARTDPRGPSQEWARFQRLQLDSLETPGGHAFTDWWDRFHQEHPEYFALQPDGERSGFPRPKHVKLCLSNPDVWAQWLADVDAALEKNPAQQVFNASENDGAYSGLCVCENCRAWDHPEGQSFRYYYEGDNEDYVAMSDRYVTFANHLARKLEERFPDRDLYVNLFAYGPAMPAPIEAVPKDNVLIGYVGHFPFTSEAERQEQKDQWAAWAKKAPNLFYRPNLWYFAGGTWGLPEVAMHKTIEDFRFLGEHNCVGIFVDTTWGHWATQGPQYYLMGRLAWNPLADGEAILDAYYQRGFGTAAPEVRQYWQLLEEARDKIVSSPEFVSSSRGRFDLVMVLEEVYANDVLERADELLSAAEAKLAGEPDRYKKRLDFVRAGYEYTRLLIETIPIMRRVRESEGEDVEAVKQAIANWDAIEQLCEQAGAIALKYPYITARIEGGYMGEMRDYLGPPSEAFRKAAGIE